MMLRQLKIFCFGPHAKRIPFSYCAYRPFFEQHFCFVEHAEQADFLVVGYVSDIRNNGEQIKSWRTKNPALQLVVFSEEPLWDTHWYKNWWDKKQWAYVPLANHTEKWPYVFINHVTSDAFNFYTLPYFLTTEDHYVQRYAHLLRQNLKLSPADLLKQWQRAAYRYRFIAEKRNEARHQRVLDSGELIGLSVYRTELAEQLNSLGASVCCEGKGWHSGLPRQSLPDWHLDKLVKVNNQSFILSAIENTHVTNYISEKIFDAYAMNALPLYWASSDHRVNTMVLPESFVNVYQQPVEAVCIELQNFVVTEPLLESYRQSQQNLFVSFSNFMSLLDERWLFSLKVKQEFEMLLN